MARAVSSGKLTLRARQKSTRSSAVMKPSKSVSTASKKRTSASRTTFLGCWPLIVQGKAQGNRCADPSDYCFIHTAVGHATVVCRHVSAAAPRPAWLGDWATGTALHCSASSESLACCGVAGAPGQPREQHLGCLPRRAQPNRASRRGRRLLSARSGQPCEGRPGHSRAKAGGRSLGAAEAPTALYCFAASRAALACPRRTERGARQLTCRKARPRCTLSCCALARRTAAPCSRTQCGTGTRLSR